MDTRASSVDLYLNIFYANYINSTSENKQPNNRYTPSSSPSHIVIVTETTKL